MTPQEAAGLLAMAAAFDNRKPDADAAQAWALALDGLRFDDCREVLVLHYRNSRDWLMPADITKGVKRLRDDRVMRMPLANPPENATSGIGYTHWLGERRKAAADGRIAEFDAQHSVPVVRTRNVDYAELVRRPPTEDDTAAARRAARQGIQESRDARCNPHKLPADSCSLCADTAAREAIRGSKPRSEGDVA